MHDTGPILIGVAVVVLVVAVVVIEAVRAARHRKAWESLAQRLGCSFSTRDPFRIERSSPQSFFRQGSGRKVRNVLYGEIEGHELKCFEYQYTTGSGDSSETHYFTPLLLTPPVSFGALSVRPETFWDRVGEFFGFDDIDFESDEFSRRFYVKCRDKRFAYDVIHARTMELLLEWGEVCIEAQDRSVLIYRSGKLKVPDEVEQLIRRGLRFLEMIPNYLIEQDRRTNG